ncbi:MAG: hypothetical protein FWD69_16175 [Polyangiaceae bacterium]|nr:hypothetical protein [Polyangiaceae bacterium]
MKTEKRIRARRHIIVRAGLLLLLVATAAACIFDRSDYQGGGRIDQGATAQTVAPTSTPDSSTPDSSEDSSLPVDDAGNIIVDNPFGL